MTPPLAIAVAVAVTASCSAAVQWREVEASFGLESSDASMSWNLRTDFSGDWGPPVGMAASEWVHRGATQAYLSSQSLLTLNTDQRRIAFTSTLAVEPGSHADGGGPLYSVSYSMATCTFSILDPITLRFAGTAFASVPYYTATEVLLSRGDDTIFDWEHLGDTAPGSTYVATVDLTPGDYTLTLGALASAFSYEQVPSRADANLNFEINLVAEPGVVAIGLAAFMVAVHRRR